MLHTLRPAGPKCAGNVTRWIRGRRAGYADSHKDGCLCLSTRWEPLMHERPAAPVNRRTALRAGLLAAAGAAGLAACGNGSSSAVAAAAVPATQPAPPD